jgi:hypothetical protein
VAHLGQHLEQVGGQQGVDVFEHGSGEAFSGQVGRGHGPVITATVSLMLIFLG